MTRIAQFTRKLHLKTDEQTWQKLEALTDNGRLSRSQIVRDCIHHAYAMNVAHVPTCASGSGCHCPHTHVFKPQPPMVG